MTESNLNLDFSKRIVIDPSDLMWQAAPAAGVFRKQFERDSAESGRVTALVRFEAGAKFDTHCHPLGEEIYVIEGIFSDEKADYPAGTYLRQPPGSVHSPYSEQGCIIFVKLDHFNPNDTDAVVITESQRHWHSGQGRLTVVPLHEFGTEHTALVKWPKYETFQSHTHMGGEEILVIDGVFSDEFGDYPQGSWLRNPDMSRHNPFSNEGCLILVKVGHLANAL